ncbi:putative polyketide synthase [Usnea florida]
MTISALPSTKGTSVDAQTHGGEHRQDIAIIGLSCRFGGDATDAGRLWDMLCEGRAAYSNKSGRFDAPLSDREEEGKTAFAGYYLRDDVYAFDANFFDISRKEAKAMDPSQRLMLEVAYEAFENSGMPLDAVAGTNTSCYVGQFVSDYREMLFRDPDSAPTYTVTGTGTSLISNRVSWFFDLRGPSFTLNTACSSSMVALHEACESLRKGESEMSVVGGSNLILSSEMFTYLRHQGFLAPDGKCKTFDISGDGYGRGEGVAALVLKPVDEAVRDGNPIRAVIRGTGVNQNGRTKGITLPSVEAQIALIKKTYRSAGLNFGETTYVEAHGTGTKVGDPLELEAIAKTLAQGRHSRHRLMVGSSKPNIGHTEATAGLAGIIKGVLALESGQLPPNIYFEKANPDIPFEEWNLAVPTELTHWPSESLRRMSACSTGYSGTNAHVILDDAYHYLMRRGLIKAVHYTKTPSQGNSATKGQRRLYVISAHDQEGILRQRKSLTSYLDRHAGDTTSQHDLLGDLAFTLSDKRSRLPWSSCETVSSLKELQSRLSGEEYLPARRISLENPKVCFVFTGQGAQWAQMGKELYHQYEVFRDSIDAATDHLESVLHCPWSATKELFCEKSSSRIDDPFFSQPLCTVLQVALLDLVESWNIRPTYIVGHSSGEIAGAYCRGALSQKDAWTIAYYRGLLSSRMLSRFPDLNGAMLAVGSSEADAEKLISEVAPGDVVVACINSPNSVTLSGNADSIQKLERKLHERGTFARRLKVKNAYHSPHMECIASDYVYAIRHLQPMDSPEERTMFSAVTGDLIDPWELGPLFWMKNLVSPVRFSEAVENMLRSGDITHGERAVDVFVEVGPHSALQGPLKQIVNHLGVKGIDYISLLSRSEDGVNTAMAAASSLYGHGVPVNVGRINGDAGSLNAKIPRMLANLPPYAWNHSHSFSAVSRLERLSQGKERENSGLLGRPCFVVGENEHMWRGFISPSTTTWLRDHEIEGSVLFPAAGYLVLAIEAAQRVVEPGRRVVSFHLRDVGISAALVVPENDDIELIVHLRPHYPATRDRLATWTEFAISSCVDGNEVRENCSGLLTIDYEAPSDSAVASERTFDELAAKAAYMETLKICPEKEDDDDFYTHLASLGLMYGPAFKQLTKIVRGNEKSCFMINTSPRNSDSTTSQPQLIHTATLDAMFHAVFAASTLQHRLLKGAMVPTFIDEVIVFAAACTSTSKKYKGAATSRKHGLRELMGDIDVLDAESLAPLVQVRDLCLRSTGSGGSEASSEHISRHICSSLSWEPVPDLESIKSTDGKCRQPEMVLLQAAEPDSRSSHLCEQIARQLLANGVQTRTLTFDVDLRLLQGTRCISLIDIDKSTFLNASADDFGTLQKAVLKCESLLWVSMNDAAGSIVPGLARTVRNEIPSLTFRTLQVSHSSLERVENLAKDITRLSLSQTADCELLHKGSTLLVPRLADDEAMNVRISDLNKDKETMEQVALENLSYPTDLSVLDPGMLGSLYFAGRSSANLPLADDELEIAVMATGLNFRDVMVAMGAIPDTTMGFEASGLVSAIGSGVKRFKVGDRVCTLGHGAHSSLFRNKEGLTQSIPKGISFEAAATLPLVHATAYNALVQVARAERGKSILIHAAAGGVGQSAIQLAQHIGLEIYATVGSEDKRRLLRETYGIADNRIFSSRDTTFAKAIKRITNGRGVDVVLNSLAGEGLRQSWHCIAPFGTFIEIGLKDIQNNFRLDMRPFMQDATFSFFNLSRMMKQSPSVVEALLASTFDLIRKKIIKPIAPLTVFPICDVEKAFRTMQTGKHRGKIALSWVQDRPVPTLIKTRSKLKLSANATYLLAGGLGGLGRSLASFLADVGAQHIVFVSRSGPQSPNAGQLLAELQRRGIQASAYKADISDSYSLEAAVTQSNKDHPPIRGVIQCAMVLQDTIFEKMTHDQWQKSLRPKVQGSLNLDRLISDGAEFFIMLSSFAGIFGNLTQSNYAAACAYQDALVYERRARGQKAVAIDLGIMRDVGYLAEHGSTGYLKAWEEPFGIRETELHSLMHLAITGDTPAQIVTGLATGGTAKAAGIDTPFYFNDPKFSMLAQTGQGQSMRSSSSSKAQALQDSIATSSSKKDAQQRIIDALSARVAKSLQMPISDVVATRPLHAHGVDSLVAVEIRTWLFQELKANVSTFDLTATIPMKSLAQRILLKCELLPKKFRE